MTTGQRPSREEQALEAIWEHFQNGADWGNALRVITQYGQDQRRDAHKEVIDIVQAKLILGESAALERLLGKLRDLQ